MGGGRSNWWHPNVSGLGVAPLWWAVEHLGHAAFYLRALMPGDFGPNGRGPLPRHAYDLDGHQLESYPVVCGVCGCVPHPETLEPIERVTGDYGRSKFFRNHIRGLEPWPEATNPATCWLCSDPKEPVFATIKERRLCRNCARQVTMTGRFPL